MQKLLWVVLGVVLAGALEPAGAITFGFRDEIIAGRVYEATSNRGVEGLVVKATPPKRSREPQKVTMTDEQGRFRFENMKERQYLLEVFQGSMLLYREVVEQGQERNISLKPRGR